MRLYSCECIAAHAAIVQERAFYGALPFALAFIVLAIIGEWRGAVVFIILGSVALGASIGAWCVARRFSK